MKKLSKVLWAFFLLVLLLFWGSWSFLQSRFFADFISTRVSTLMTHTLKIKVGFERVDLDFFPLGVSLYNVHLETKDPKINLYIHQLDLYVDLFSLLLNKVVLKSVVAQNGSLDFSYTPKTEETDLSWEMIQKQIDLLLSDKSKSAAENVWELSQKFLPISIKMLHLKEIIIKSESNSLMLSSFHSVLDSKSLQVEMNAENIVFFDSPQQNFDSFDVKLTLDDHLRLERFKVLNKLSDMSIQGKIILSLQKIEESALDLEGGIRLDLPFLMQIAKLEKYVPVAQGQTDAYAKIKGQLKNPSIIIDGGIRKLDCKYANVSHLDYLLALRDQKIILEKLYIENSNDEMIDDNISKVNLLEPVTLFDFKGSVVLPDPIIVYAENTDTNLIFYFLHGDLDPWRGQITGKIVLKYKDDILEIKKAPEVLAKMENFALYFPKNNLTVIHQESVILNNVLVFVNLKSEDVSFKAGLNFQNTTIDAVGTISHNIIKVDATSPQFDFTTLGPIAGQQLKGVGKVILGVHGDLKKDVFMDLNLDLKETEILGFRLGEVKTDASLNFKNLNLEIIGGKGQVGKTSYSVVGNLDFEKKKVELDVEAPTATIPDLVWSYRPLVEQIPSFPSDLTGIGNMSYHVSGGMEISKLDVVGKAVFRNLTWKEEVLPFAEAEFVFQKNRLGVTDILVKKEEGEFKGSFSYNLSNGEKEYQFDLNNWELMRFSLVRKMAWGLNGKLVGSIYGKHTLAGIDEGNLELYLIESQVQGLPIANSSLLGTVHHRDIKGKANILGGMITSDFFIDLDPPGNERRSHVDVWLKSDDVAFLLSVFGVSGLHDSGVVGAADTEFQSSFRGADWRKMDGEFKINKFFLQKDSLRFEIQKENSKISINNGSIDAWKIVATGSKGYFSSIASGTLFSSMRMDNLFNFDAEILELFSGKIISSSGSIENKLVINGFDSLYLAELESTGKNIELLYAGVPGAFEDVSYEFVMNNKEFRWKFLNGKFANGRFNVGGKIDFIGNYPMMNLNYTIDAANLNIFEKSFFTVNGSGFLSGEAPPYILSGDFSIIKGVISDEFDKMSQGKKDIVTINKYIPRIKKKGVFDSIHLDIRTNILDNIYLKNSMAEMRFNGDLEIVGNLNTPRVGGEINLSSDTNKFYFKSNEFKIRRGQISFYKNDPGINPEINFEALSHVSDYDLMLGVTGKASNPSIEFSASPYLSQQDIFSLLTIGVTGDVSQGLSARERDQQYLASAGGFLLDKIQLNENLKSALGLNVSLSSDISQNDANSLNAPIESIQSNQYRAGTKININKKISRRIDISASSTLGGETTSKQEFNINFKINKKFSLDGVYESRPDENYKGGNTNSLGADFKFKWMFK